MRKYLKHLYVLCSLAALLGLVGAAGPAAATSSTSNSGVVIQSYSASSSVLPGMLVALNPKVATTVIPLTMKNIGKMLGVVVPLSDTSLVLTPQPVTTQQVLVATSGSYNLLVSNEDGPIKTGDYLTASSVAGIAMKANTDEAEIVGRAAGNFQGNSNIIETVSLKNNAGGSTAVTIGHIPVNVYLASNPLFQKTPNNLPGFLSRAASTVADGPVSSVRVYISAVVLLIVLIVTATMFYSSVRNGIVAVGRNPLAKRAIGRSLLQTIIGALIIFIAGLLGVYLILKL